MAPVTEAGRRGEKVRSDCWVRVELQPRGGVELHVTSTNESDVRALGHEVLDALGAKDALVAVEDQDAPPFVLAARIEAAGHRANQGERGLEDVDASPSRG